MSPPPHRDQFLARVLSNVPLCREHFRLVLGLPTSFPTTEPGQFVQIACSTSGGAGFPACDDAHEREWREGHPVDLLDPDLRHPVALLRRPFSLAGRRDTPDGVELDIIHRVVGVGTDWLADLRVGDRVGILGPLGNRFQLPSEEQTALLVGGGVGIPPMIYLAEKLAGRRAVVFSGALTRELLPLTIEEGARTAQRNAGNELPAPADAGGAAAPRLNIAEFARHGIPAVLTTDDGSFGFRGFVTQALEAYLDHAPRITDRASNLIYTCGPEPMMKRVQSIAAERGLPCQIAVERAMACGMGTCQSCCIRVRKPDPSKPPLAGRDWCYRLACTDGPVFRGEELLW